MTSEPNQNKQLLFLVAQPRSGNTLFASIMNQNPEIAATPNSITLEIIKDLFLLKQTDVFQNFPDHKSLDNVLDIVYDTYYKDWPQRIIIDRGPVTTPGNFELMQKHFKRPFKCIVLLRDLMDVLASYMQWYTENPDAFPNRFGLQTDEEKLAMIMNKDGAVAKDLEAIKNSYNYKDMCHYVKYDDMVDNPEQEFKDSLYKKSYGETLLCFPSPGIKQAMATAALETDGIKKTTVNRLLFLPEQYVNVWGTPYLKMDIVRSADINKTPDVRTRGYLPRWCAEVRLRFIAPALSTFDVTSLLSNAGAIVGIGDYRQEKGRGSFGCFDVFDGKNKNIPEWDDIVKESREAQQHAMDYPICADPETEELMEMIGIERQKRAA